MRSIILAAVLTVFCSSAALADDYAALLGRRLDLGCHDGRCDHSTIETVAEAGSSSAAKLFIVATRDTVDDTAIRRATPASMSVAVVLCSKTKPSVAYPSEGGRWSVTYLHPTDEADINGATEASYLVYFATCHRTMISRPQQVVQLATKLGYHMSAAVAEPQFIGSPLALIQP